MLYDPILSSYTVVKHPGKQLVNAADSNMHQLFYEMSLLSGNMPNRSSNPRNSSFCEPSLQQQSNPSVISLPLSPLLPTHQFLAYVKSSLICSNPSNNFLETYFSSSSILYQCWISGLGSCLINLTVYQSKDIYSDNHQYFKM